jgi:endogenous inhibitor of DNA gyrase (YacG/DUF329 family)
MLNLKFTVTFVNCPTCGQEVLLALVDVELNLFADQCPCCKTVLVLLPEDEDGDEAE